MPIIAKFYGIVLKMYFKQREHNPPHLHATYGECDGVFRLSDGEMIEGNLSLKEREMVTRFIKYYTLKLVVMWESQNYEMLPPIE